MADSIKSNDQTDQFSEDNLLDELRATKSVYCSSGGTLRGQNEGSLLLDSINEYLQGPSGNIQTISEAEEIEAGPLSIINQTSTRLEKELSAQIQGVQDGQLNNNYEYKCLQNEGDPFPKDTNSAQAQLLIPQNNEQSRCLLVFSHYNSRNQDRLGRNDINTSLIVQTSNQKSSENQIQCPLSLQNESDECTGQMGELGYGFSNGHLQFESDIINKSKSSRVSVNGQELIHKLAADEERQEQAPSNWSVDSSKLITLVPLEYLSQERCTINCNIEEPPKQLSINILCEISEPERIENMDILQIASRREIPMDIQQNHFQNIQVPMEIESVGFHPSYQHSFPNFQQEFNTITFEPIQQKNNLSAVQQQRYEEQQMLDSMNTISHPNQKPNHNFKQFTFGKEEGMPNIHEIIKEEVQKSMEKDLHYQSQIKDNQCNQWVKDYNYQNQIHEEGLQNLSLNVEHDMNFSDSLKELEQMPTASLKNQVQEINLNSSEPILTNIQNVNTEHQEQINLTSSYESIIYFQNKLKKQSNQLLLEESFKQSLPNVNDTLPNVYQTDSNISPSRQINVIEIRDLEQEIQLNSPINRHENHQQIIQAIPVERTNEEANPKVDFSNKKNKYVANKFSYNNNVCSYNFGLQPLFLPQNDKRVHLNPSQNQKPQIIIHNDNYHLSPNENPMNQAQGDFMSNQFPSFSPQPAQINMQMPPCITINYKNNEMFVSIAGPAFNYNSQNLLNKNGSNIFKLPETTQNKVESFSNESNQQKITKSFVDTSGEENKSYESQIEFKKQKIVNKHKKKAQKQINSSSKDDIKSNKQTSQLQVQEQSYEDHNERYNFVVSQSQNYLLSFSEATEATHKQFQKIVSHNVFLRFTPEPKTDLGTQLFKNGLFLIALVKLIARSSQTSFIYCYMYEYLESAYGLSIQRNRFIFKSQCDKAKKCYQNGLQKKYSEIAEIINPFKQREQQKNQAIKRRVITTNPFFSIQCEKKDQCFQASPEKSNIPQKENSLEKQNNVSVIKIEKNPQLLIISSKKKEFERPNDPEYSNANCKNQISSQIVFNPKAEISHNNTSPPIQKKIKQVSQDKKIAHNIVQKNDFSSNNDKNVEKKIKINIEQIKSSIGSYAKKSDDKNDFNSNEKGNKFSELYEKYRRIRETKKSDQLIENSQIKRNIIQQEVTADKQKRQDKQQSAPQRKATKKQVLFPDEIVMKDIADNGDYNQQDLVKRKKKKKGSKGWKKDNSADSSEQDDNSCFNKTRKGNSKK